jgi:signal transduction histidine kinase
MLRGLRGKLILSHLAVIFVVMSLTTFLLLTLGQTYFMNALERSLLAQAELIAQALIPGASPAQPPAPAYNAVQQQQLGNVSVQLNSKDASPESDLGSALSESNLAYLHDFSLELSATLETRFSVLDNRGVVLLDSHAQGLGEDLSGEEAVAAALLGEQWATTRQINRQDWLFVSLPLMIEGQVGGVILLGQPLRDVAAVLSDLRTRLLLVMAIALPLSALVGLLLARNFARPIQKLTVASGKLIQGDFNYPLDTSGDDEIGHLSRTFAAMRDQLQAVERMRTRFVSDVSHELRTPLTAVKGLVETLREGAVEDPAVRGRFLASMEAETDRLIRLVNDLLVLSRADSQALELQRKTVDIEALSRACIQRLTPKAESRQVRIKRSFSDQSWLVNADPDRIEQVLINLLDNALKYSPEGGTVHVEGFRLQTTEPLQQRKALSEADLPDPLLAGAWVVVAVTDEGEGITSEELPHVFDRFYRAEPSRARKRGGTGLGLSIAKALLEAHGGLIWLESPSPRTRLTPQARPGTTAFFALPLQEQ